MPTVPVMITPLESFGSSPEELSEWFSHRVDAYKSRLTEEGRLPPIVHFLAPNPKNPVQTVEGIFPLWLFVNSDEGKDAAARIIPELLAQVKAFACLTVMEAWVKALSPTEVRMPGPVSQMPGREEALIFLEETMEASRYQTWTFTRENEQIVFTKYHDLDEGTKTGRFSTFLQPDARRAAAQ